MKFEASDRYISMSAGDTSLILDCAVGSRPAILHWGPVVSDTPPENIDLMLTRQHAHGGPDEVLSASLMNETGAGFPGPSGFSAHRAGRGWSSLFVVDGVERPSESEVIIRCSDKHTKIAVAHYIGLDPETGVMTAQTMVENLGSDVLTLDWCAAANLPLDPRMTRVTGFKGGWAMEFQTEEIPLFQGSYVRENKAGRTSHDSFPGLLAGSPETVEQSGPCYAFHLGWSGNHRLRIDRLSDGRAFAQFGECFFPGEMILAPGGVYRSPVVFAGYSTSGYSTLSRRFHRHLRTRVMDGRITGKPRPVHYNTWEAVYFDHDTEKLKQLAEKAADVGAERFVLDDGWFGGRRSDKSGLGDWWPSEDVYPDGLGPLITHVRSLGMEFGLWFEPEMVNPDSELYRNHPDWILRADGVDQIKSRSQYVLDLTKPEVSEYLFEKMHKILSDHDSSYVKWDMNRDIHHPGSEGRPAASKQTRAVYALIDRLRRAHPELEIESCASGGGRADYGVLQRTDRIWTSDSNDALDRQMIQRGASNFFPLDVMGAHVGPAVCHITGRRLRMELRVATAFFGHMGMELDLLRERAADIEILKRGVALHKAHRALLHTGDFHRLDTPEYINAVGVVSADQSEALFSWCVMGGHIETAPPRFYFAGLDPQRSYRVSIIWPSPVRSQTKPSILEAADLGGEGAVFTGEALMRAGLQTPIVLPETCLICRLAAEE